MTEGMDLFVTDLGGYVNCTSWRRRRPLLTGCCAAGTTRSPRTRLSRLHKLLIFCLSGMRQWPAKYGAADAVVFMIDSHDNQRLDEARHALEVRSSSRAVAAL